MMPPVPVLATLDGIDPGGILCEAIVMSARYFLLFSLMAWLPLASVGAETPLARLAVVNLTAVFEAHPRTARATAQLTADRNAARKDFRARSEELKNLLQSHQELIRNGRQSEAAAALERANDLERSIAELATTNQRDLEEKFRQTKQEIMTDIARTVREFNASAGYTLILDQSAASANGLPQVLDAPGAEDITAQIIARVKSGRAP